MRTKDFDFELPSELVALRPREPRGSSRLMVVLPDGGMEHRNFQELPLILKSPDILSLNDSRVIPARLEGRRPGRGQNHPEVAIEIFLHKRTGTNQYEVFARPGKRLRTGDQVIFSGELEARVQSRTGAVVELEFNRSGAALDQAVAETGSMPLPPYIARKRSPDERDRIDYQTVYARHDGSVAAPTAGLHFTPEMLEKLAYQGVAVAPITLHVGAGTFLPVASEDTKDHRMHAEWAQVNLETAAKINATRRAGGRLVAVGTTALRTLESAADTEGVVHPITGETDIFITPGYRFRCVDMLLTNFHLPRSTLFMLVSAFMGTDVMKHAYAEAIRERYRFYSYGDACLLVRPQ